MDTEMAARERERKRQLSLLVFSLSLSIPIMVLMVGFDFLNRAFDWVSRSGRV